MNEDGELIFDLFAGAGGASTAILQATGRHPDVAVNHDRDAVDLHRANHPATLHYCCDIAEVDPVEVLTHFPDRKVGLLWASPDCTHHSKARGGKPAEKKIRALAWHVIRWAAAIKKASGSAPRMIALENVEEFADWGPLGRDDRPIKARRGETFKLWVSQLESLGYRVEHRELVAADFGAPTTRKRLFLIARSDGQPVEWPAVTHAKRGAMADLFDAPLQPWRAAAEIIDWSLPTPSIFARKRPLAPATRRRIAKGVKRFVIEAARPFIVPLTHTGADRLHDVADPLRTITTANRGELALATPFLAGTAHGDARERAGLRAWPVDEPMRVVKSSNDAALASVHLTKFSENSIGTDPDEPLHTAMAGAPRHGVVAAYLGRQFGSTVSGRALADPHPAVMTDGAGGKSHVVTAHIGRQFGRSVGTSAEEPVGAVVAGGGGKTQVVAPVIDKYYGAGVAHAPDKPLDSVTAKGRFGLAAAHIEQANTGMTGHPVERPLSTIVGGGASSGRGATQRLIETALGDEAGPRRRAVLEFLWEHFGEPTDAEIADPLASATGRLKFGIVVLDEVEWRIVDIGMRMLTPRELYAAQGFPIDYVIETTWEGRPLTKTAQTRMAGNSVSPPPAEALLRANLTWMALPERAAA